MKNNQEFFEISNLDYALNSYTTSHSSNIYEINIYKERFNCLQVAVHTNYDIIGLGLCTCHFSGDGMRSEMITTVNCYQQDEETIVYELCGIDWDKIENKTLKLQANIFTNN